MKRGRPHSVLTAGLPGTVWAGGTQGRAASQILGLLSFLGDSPRCPPSPPHPPPCLPGTSSVSAEPPPHRSLLPAGSHASPPPPAHGSETLFPEGALYSSFIFRGSANKFLPNCPQTKKVHISALKVTGGIADQAWHICRPPPELPTICSHGHPPPQLPASSSGSCPSIFPTSLLTPSLPPTCPRIPPPSLS